MCCPYVTLSFTVQAKHNAKRFGWNYFISEAIQEKPAIVSLLFQLAKQKTMVEKYTSSIVLSRLISLAKSTSDQNLKIFKARNNTCRKR